MSTKTITHSIDAPRKARGMGQDPDPEVPAKARRRQFSGRYKAQVLATYDQLPKAERGLFCAGRASTAPTSPSGATNATGGPSKPWPRLRDGPCPTPGQGGGRSPQGERAPGPGARQSPPGDLGAGKTLGAVGTARHGQRRSPRRDEVTDLAIETLPPPGRHPGGVRRRGRVPGALLPPAPENAIARAATARAPTPALGAVRGRTLGGAGGPAPPRPRRRGLGHRVRPSSWTKGPTWPAPRPCTAS